MSQFAPEHLTEEEIQAAIGLEKILIGDLTWEEKPTNSSFLVFSSVLVDGSGATLPGFTVEFLVRRGRFLDDCRFDFGLFKLKGQRRLRVYQINVMSRERISHREPNGEQWFGPHQHFGERAEKFGAEVVLGCADHEKWFHEFIDRAHVNFGGRYVSPTLGSLF